MSENNELIKNNPNPSDGYGYPDSGYFAASGGVANLGIGGTTPVAGAYPWGTMGQLPPPFTGEGNALSIDPSGAPGGILNPEQARRFIDYVWDSTVLAQDGRRVTMRANTIELEKVNVGERVIRAANQGLGDYVNTGATFSKVDLTTTKIRLDWEVSTEALEDNIEGGALEDHLVRLMTNAFANDLEDLAINGVGVGTSDPFLAIMKGFCYQVQNGNGLSTGGQAHEATTGTITNWTPEVLQELINALPRRYRAVRSGLRYYAGTETFANIVASNGTLDGGTGVYTFGYRDRYLDGNDQAIGNARQTRVLGLPVLEVPNFPAEYVELTFPQNRVWGFQRDITVNRQYMAKKDTIEYTVFVRFGIAWEELDAVAWASATGNPVTTS
jgi:HK97 family phage major capsid protein